MTTPHPTSRETLSRSEFYTTVCTQLSASNAVNFSRLLDAAISVGLGALTETNWKVYLEMAFDLACARLLSDSLPEALRRFPEEFDRIENVLGLMGGADKLEAAYLETRVEVWSAFLQGEDNQQLFNTVRNSPVLFDTGVTQQFASLACRLINSAAGIGDFAAMADPNYVDEWLPLKAERVEPYVADFRSSLCELATVINDSTTGEEPKFVYVGGKVRVNVSSTPLDGVATVVSQVYADSDALSPKSPSSLVSVVFEDARRVKVSRAVEVCLSRFVDGEMDFETPGNRGLGRASEFCPRFGGLHREMLCNLNDEAKDEIAEAIRMAVLSGFVFSEIVVGISGRQVPEATGKEMFEDMWMPVYYTPTFEAQFGDVDIELASHWANTVRQRLRVAITDNGGAWTNEDNKISHAYFEGGMKLRQLVARSLPASERLDALTGGLVSLQEKAEQVEASGCLVLLMVPAVFLASLCVSFYLG